MLQRLSQDVDTATINHPAYPFPVIMATISENELFNINASPYNKSTLPGYTSLYADELNIAEYTAWHKEEIEVLVVDGTNI